MVILVGYAGYRVLTAPPPPDRLRVLAIPGDTPADLTLPIDQTFTDPEQVREIYAATLALPKVVIGAGACLGRPDHEAYQLTFSPGHQIVIQVTAYLGGCPEVEITPSDGNNKYDARWPTHAYWVAMSHLLNVPERGSRARRVNRSS